MKQVTQWKQTFPHIEYIHIRGRHSPFLWPSVLHPHALYQSVHQERSPSAPAASHWPQPSGVKTSAASPTLKHTTTTGHTCVGTVYSFRKRTDGQVCPHHCFWGLSVSAGRNRPLVWGEASQSDLRGTNKFAIKQIHPQTTCLKWSCVCEKINQLI